MKLLSVIGVVIIVITGAIHSVPVDVHKDVHILRYENLQEGANYNFK